jgi:hypothetical protein
MMMITKEIAKNLITADKAFLESDDGRTSDEIVVKFFNPVGAATWWIVSGTPLNAINGEADYDTDNPADWHLFGFATLGDARDAELGYVLLSQLKEIKGMFGLGIERDMYYSGGSLKAVMAEVKEAA